MADEITISKTLNIRDCGLKEGWLQDQIEKDPSILGLGDLEVVRREKTQSSGGRLDFLLQDSQDSADGSMYESVVEFLCLRLAAPCLCVFALNNNNVIVTHN